MTTFLPYLKTNLLVAGASNSGEGSMGQGLRQRLRIHFMPPISISARRVPSSESRRCKGHEFVLSTW